MVAKVSAKSQKGIGMEGVIAKWYAGITKNNLKDFQSDAKRMMKYLSPGAAVLEVAPGPGYLAIELAKLGNYRIVGLDISHSFVEIAKGKARDAGVQVDFRQGDVSQMPFEDGMFNLIICRAAFKNFAAPVTALNEMHRVLKVGGKAVIIDLRGDASAADMNKAVDEMGLGSINRFMTKWTFQNMLIKRAYTTNSFRELIAKSNFQKYDIQRDAIGMEICLEK